jgi:hypothetical protein
MHLPFGPKINPSLQKHPRTQTAGPIGFGLAHVGATDGPHSRKTSLGFGHLPNGNLNKKILCNNIIILNSIDYLV